MNKLINPITIIILMPIVIFTGWLSWHFGRQINYRYSYKDMVQQTVREMVKDNCLIKEHKN